MADGLIRSATARGAETAWAMMCLARIAMERGLLTDANLCLTLLCSQAGTARTPVARRIRRDLPGLAGTLAVMRAITPNPDGAPIREYLLDMETGDSRRIGDFT